MANELDVSIVIPCFNEEGHIRRSFAEIVRTMSMANLTHEFIFVDDCSEDRTREIIESLSSENENVRYVFHERNKGRGGAVKTGISVSRGRVAGFLDIDLEVHSRYIPSMVDAVLSGADVACGYRVYRLPWRFDDIFRDILSVGYRWLVRRLLNTGVNDTEAGYEFFNVERTRSLFEASENDGWFWDTEIMSLAHNHGMRVAEVPMVYTRNPDKVSTVKPVRDAVDSFKALTAYRRKNAVSLTYKSPFFYHTLMKMLYRNRYDERFEAISAEIPEGAAVLDVCCGDCRLFRKFLKKKNVAYIGLDINAGLIAPAVREGVDARLCDIELEKTLPPADYAVIQSSLYQFIPKHREMIAKLAAAASKAVIITEGLTNPGNSGNPLVRRIGHILNNPGTGVKTERFTLESLEAALGSFRIMKKKKICMGREALFIIDISVPR
ncbi:MAG TPA: glycosyltransferase [bacterium]|nr:glycosyltransferase [bacterium]